MFVIFAHVLPDASNTLEEQVGYNALVTGLVHELPAQDIVINVHTVNNHHLIYTVNTLVYDLVILILYQVYSSI